MVVPASPISNLRDRGSFSGAADAQLRWTVRGSAWGDVGHHPVRVAHGVSLIRRCGLAACAAEAAQAANPQNELEGEPPPMAALKRSQLAHR